MKSDPNPFHYNKYITTTASLQHNQIYLTTTNTYQHILLEQNQIFHKFMAAFQASNLLYSSSSSSSPFSHRRIGGVVATLQVPKTRKPYLSLPKLPTRKLIEELSTQKPKEMIIRTNGNTITARNDDETQDSMVMAELYMIMETVVERVEMHGNIGEQRNNWNNLLLNSINAITITAATMTGLASSTAVMGSPLLALKISSTLLYAAATGMLLVMNKIQPSQLAEEQRNAVRLFKQLHSQVQTTIALGNPTSMDVKNAMANVLALDRAFPLPLLGGVMIEKFPETVEPAVWWPQQQQQQKQQNLNANKGGKTNGWSGKLEEELMEIVEVLKNKDTEEYVRLSKMVLKINKILAISGPLLTGIAAFGSAFVGTSPFGSAAVLCGVVGGAMATVVNTMEHGGQIGMVFEMYRNCAGSFGLLQETIESTLKETEVEKRENGELFEMKVALKLGRSLSELRNLAFSSSSRDEGHSNTDEFASKIF